jgi:hypothetical protein
MLIIKMKLKEKTNCDKTGQNAIVSQYSGVINGGYEGTPNGKSANREHT